MICMLITGYASVAAEYGSDSDPLITKSYLEHVLTPSITNSVNTSIKNESDKHRSALELKILELSQALDNKIASIAANLSKNDDFAKKVANAVNSEGNSTNTSNNNGSWEVLEIEKGSFLKLEVNTQVVVQKGIAKCIESAGTGLTDISIGNVLLADEALLLNHKYIATTNGSGLHATEKVTVLVDGGYSIA